MLTALSRLASRASLALAGVGLVAMTIIISWQVFARYVLNASPSWSEQAALLAMTWFVLLAAASGVREGFHIRILAGLEALPPALRRATELATHGVVAAIGASMVVAGVSLTLETWAHTLPGLGISRGVGYLPLPISGVLIVLFALEHMAASVRGREVKPSWS